MSSEEAEWQHRQALIDGEANALLARHFTPGEEEHEVRAFWRAWKAFMSFDNDEIARLRLLVECFEIGYLKACVSDGAVTEEEYRERLSNL